MNSTRFGVRGIPLYVYAPFSQLIFLTPPPSPFAHQWDLPTEAPDLFLHLSRSRLVFFKGDLNHRKLTYDCAAPSTTVFEEAIGGMAGRAGAPRVCSMRTIKVSGVGC